MFIVHDHNLILTGLQPGDGGPEELAKTVLTALIYLTHRTAFSLLPLGEGSGMRA